jgi:hypothetical protein
LPPAAFRQVRNRCNCYNSTRGANEPRWAGKRLAAIQCLRWLSLGDGRAAEGGLGITASGKRAGDQRSMILGDQRRRPASSPALRAGGPCEIR